MSLLLLFNGSGVIHASASITEANDSLTAAVGVLVSSSAAITEAGDSDADTATVLVSASDATTEAADSIAASSAVSVSASAGITEGNDALSATSATSALVLTTGIGGAGGYIRRVKPKPLAKPKPAIAATVAVIEQDDAVVSAATVEGQSLAERKRRVIEHNNDFLMAA